MLVVYGYRLLMYIFYQFFAHLQHPPKMIYYRVSFMWVNLNVLIDDFRSLLVKYRQYVQVLLKHIKERDYTCSRVIG